MKIFKKIQFVFFATALLSCTSVFAAPQDDAAIQQNIVSKIAADNTVSGNGIEVRSDDGVVSLNGTARSDQDASKIVEIAAATPGVKEVNTSDLKTPKSDHPVDDSYITAKVKGEFIKNKLFGDHPAPVMSVSVETENGVVSLTGTAETKQQAENAVRLAQSVKGVKKVVSHVVVK